MIDDQPIPFMRMIRNAIDQRRRGARRRASRQERKPERGTVQLTAFPKGNHVVVTVEDDGAGIDPKVVLCQGSGKGIIEAGHGLDLPRGPEGNPGPHFSCPASPRASRGTERSGRAWAWTWGRRTSPKLSGIIDIETETGAGTKALPSCFPLRSPSSRPP